MAQRGVDSGAKNTSTTRPALSSSKEKRDSVLSEIHVSCYITAANRATPVFEVLPQRNRVRVVTKPLGDGVSGASGIAANDGILPTTPACGAYSGNSLPAAAWNFHSVFVSGSPSHAMNFFREITQPALRSARDGINANVVVWGVHPTQKFRLLFGKSVGGNAGGVAPTPHMSIKDVVELYGQLGGLLREFFSTSGSEIGLQDAVGQEQRFENGWRLGISSWIIVNNQVFDLLKPKPSSAGSVDDSKTSTSLPTTDTPPLSFVSLEATSLASAFRIVQTAKTNRIVCKQNAEHAHFFLRLAFFHCGQVSTLHFVDLIDQKDFQDTVSAQEKLEIYNILQGLRQPPLSPRLQSVRSPDVSASSVSGKMALSNFVLPLLTANAKTFLYANVIDSRTSLRESVRMLNAVANLKGFACVCKRLQGVEFMQLDFQSAPSSHGAGGRSHSPVKKSVSMATSADVATAESLLSRLASASGSLPCEASQMQIASSSERTGAQEPPASPSTTAARESEAMSWLEAFTQRKRDILGGSIDAIGISAAAGGHDGGTTTTTLPSSSDSLRPELQGTHSLQVTKEDTVPSSSIDDLYESLRESMESTRHLGAPTSPHASNSACLVSPVQSPSVSNQQLPITDQDGPPESLCNAVDSNIKASTSPWTTQSRQQDSDTRSAWSQLANPIENPDQRTSNRLPSDNNPYDASKSKSGTLLTDVEAVKRAKHPMSSASPPPWQAGGFKPADLESFKKVGIPTHVVASPNVEGLDVSTAQKVQAADAALLRKNYDALLSIVREQQQAKELAETRAAEALHDQEEQRAMFEVQIENMKLANVGLRSKVRALEKRTALPHIFDQYEQELRALQAQVQSLQQRNVALELRVAGMDASSGSGSGPDLKKKYLQVVEEKLALERELAEQRKRERHLQVHSRLAGESTRRVDQLARDLSVKEEALIATRLGKQRLNAEMNQALEKADQLHQENEKLLLEKAATTEELLAARMYLASLDNEKKKAAVLDRFVEKHGDRMTRLRQRDPAATAGNGAPKSESWRRDRYARECEDKLLVAVKRSLPQAVPLVNKLIRRLELQELSLREFSEREVDFIGLLVDLVSDQPADSLKRMIEEEMQKLQPC